MIAGYVHHFGYELSNGYKENRIIIGDIIVFPSGMR